MFWVPMALMAAAGAAKGMSNNEKGKQDQKMREAAIRYSPWTGMSDPGVKDRPGILSSSLQGGMMGAMMGQALGAPTAATGATGAVAGAGGGAAAAAPSTWDGLMGGDTWLHKLTGSGQFDTGGKMWMDAYKKRLTGMEGLGGT